MKRLLVALSLTLALTSISFGKDPKPPFKIPERPEWARGCHNEVLKKGYVYYMSPRALAGMVALMVAEAEEDRPLFEAIHTREFFEVYGEIAQIPEDEDTTAAFLAGVVYPLESKGFIKRDNSRSGRMLWVRSQWRGQYAAEMQMKTFWEIYLRTCERREKNPVDLNKLSLAPGRAKVVPPMELSEFLILSSFYSGKSLGSSEVYNEIRNDLSYYKIFFPLNTAGAVLPRLRSYVRTGWLSNAGLNYQDRAEGGSVYKFRITPEGREAFRQTEDFYLRVAAFYRLTLTADKFDTFFEVPKPKRR